MTQFIEKNRKKIFYLILVLTYICIFTYIFLTPYLSDDYSYMTELRDMGTGNIGDVFRLAFVEYFQHGGRLVHYTNFRLFLFAPSKHIYDFVASIYFVILGLLVYANINGKKKYDIGVLMGSFLGIWLFAVRPGQTILQITGGAVYLFATVYIIGSITYYRYLLNKECIKKPILSSIIMFVLALLAGNSSENNSAAIVLICLIITITEYCIMKKKSPDSKLSVKSFVKPYMITAFAGYVIGYGILILSPGAWNRVDFASDDNYEGILGILSHIYKITVALKELFLPLLIVVGVLLTILVIAGKFRSFEDIIRNTAVLYLIAFFAGSYALFIISIPEYRVFFGASIFLIVAIIQLLQDVATVATGTSLPKAGNMLKYAVIVSLCIVFTFSYFENLVNLARIYREKNEQVSILEDAVANENTSYVEIPQLHEPFDNDFTMAYYPQLNQDPGFWLNIYYEAWFGIDQISAIPRDIWDENH